MLKELINNFLEFFSPLAVLLTFLILRKHWKSTGFMRILFVYYLCSSINLGVATYLAYVNAPSNIFWYNLHGFLSAVTLSLFYHQILKSAFSRILVAIMATAGIVAYVIILTFFDDRITFNSTGYSIISFLIILYSFLFLREVFSFSNNDPLHAEVTVWIVSALLTYYLSSFLIQLSYKNVTRFLATTFSQKAHDSWVWGIHNVLYFLANMIIMINLVRFSRFVSSGKNNLKP